jgi:hypothetical protein
MFDLQFVIMKKPAPLAFRCPSCMAEYKVVVVESPLTPARHAVRAVRLSVCLDRRSDVRQIHSG